MIPRSAGRRDRRQGGASTRSSRYGTTPETASRLRGQDRGGARLGSRRRTTTRQPGGWTGWLKTKLAAPKKLGKLDRKTGSGSSAATRAMPYRQGPGLHGAARPRRPAMRPGAAAHHPDLRPDRRGLAQTWDEIDFAKETWRIPASADENGQSRTGCRSATPAFAILRAPEIGAATQPVRLSRWRPRKPLSNMAMAMLMRRMGVASSRSTASAASARSLMAENGVRVQTGRSLSRPPVGNTMVASYTPGRCCRFGGDHGQWADFVAPPPSDNVIELRRTQALMQHTSRFHNIARSRRPRATHPRRWVNRAGGGWAGGAGYRQRKPPGKLRLSAYRWRSKCVGWYDIQNQDTHHGFR